MATSQYYAVHMAPKVAYATQQDNTDLKNAQVPIQAGTIVIDSSQTPFQVLGIADGSGNFGPVGLSFGNYSWATRPSAASVPVGTIITITDIPTGGRTQFYSNGTGWCTDGYKILASSSVPSAPITGDVVEHIMGSVTVPGGLLGTNGGLWVYSRWTFNSNANLKVFRTTLGATVFAQTGPSGSLYAGLEARIDNRNSQASQLGATVNNFYLVQPQSTLPFTGTENTAVDKTLTVSLQLANAGDNATLEAWQATFISRW